MRSRSSQEDIKRTVDILVCKVKKMLKGCSCKKVLVWFVNLEHHVSQRTPARPTEAGRAGGFFGLWGTQACSSSLLLHQRFPGSSWLLLSFSSGFEEFEKNHEGNEKPFCQSRKTHSNCSGRKYRLCLKSTGTALE